MVIGECMRLKGKSGKFKINEQEKVEIKISSIPQNKKKKKTQVTLPKLLIFPSLAFLAFSYS